MRYHSLAIVACLALATAACEPARRDVQINWTFNNGQSCSAAGVATIEIDINGQYLSPNQFACTDSAGNLTTGVDLGRFLTGNYYVTITGFDATGNPSYQTSQDIFVTSDKDPNVFSIDVQPYVSDGTGQGDLVLLWTFGGESCAASGVSTVNVTLDGTPVTDYSNNPDIACDDQGTDGVEIGPIPTGTHAVTISATSASGVSYSASLSAVIADGIETTLSPNLTASGTSDGGTATDGGTSADGGANTDGGTQTDGGTTADGGASTDGGATSDGGTITDGGSTTATANISWSFAGLGCSDAQVDTVTVFVDGASAGSVACSSNGSDSGSISGIAPGTHGISIAAVRGSQLVYQSASSTSATFVAGTSTHVIVAAPATSPGTGGATLTLTFPSGGPDCATTTGNSTTVTYTLTSPAGVAQAPQTFQCGGAGGASAISICDPGAAGCGAGNAGLSAGEWQITATATGYSASAAFPVPNDAVDSSTVAFTAN